MKKNIISSLLVLAGYIGWAQNSSGNIKGKVTNKQNKLLASVSVLIENKATGTITSQDGDFLLHDLQEQSYTITFSLVGYEKNIVTTSVHSGQATTLNIILQESETVLRELTIKDSRLHNQQIERLADVAGTYVLAGKKNEVIQVSNLNANLAEKTGRQLFAKIPGVFA